MPQSRITNAIEVHNVKLPKALSLILTLNGAPPIAALNGAGLCPSKPSRVGCLEPD